MEKITDLSRLPELFRNRTYHKQLSDIDWYREIRRRQKIGSLVGLHVNHGILNTYESRTELSEMLAQDNVRPDSLIYYIPQNTQPVHDLTVGESVFLAFSASQPKANSVIDEYRKLLSLWPIALEEWSADDDRPTPSFGKYETELAAFVERCHNEDKYSFLESPISTYYEKLENPWLSYSRPLNGYPLTIDTQFDDETILQHVKNWIRNKREHEGSKARRPYNQNDFDDWEYYKIREIFDLQTWAAINNTKILDRVLAEALWPNSPDNFSPIDVLRTTARKKTAEVFTFETAVRMYSQLLANYGENFLTQ
ncbi:MAG: hypothetical protein KZQ75_05145 [Candidatus Thiodiazotropha sp. (ex Myrtea spinifera)]|nr:hypothetical protein [Candidatus Thiodiazotropha sp. (ex Myrtea spinifera)]